MGQRITVVDAFTDRPFTGNPAAVCLLDRAVDEEWMRLVAREMNLSETAFLIPEGDGFRLRWLSPTVEVDLCGHATLASSHVLWDESHVPTDQEIIFFTRSGELRSRRSADLIELDFPADSVELDQELITPLQSALGATILEAGRGRFDLMAQVEDESTLRSLMPDFPALARFTARGMIVTSRSDSSRYDFVSRFFAPAAGIDEDPVTGSAHCALATYWGSRLDKTKMTGYQASARGGEVQVEQRDDRVILGGKAVTCWRGEILHTPF